MIINEEISNLWKASFSWDSCRMSEEQKKALSEQYSLQTIQLFEKLIDKNIQKFRRRYKYAQTHYLSEELEKKLFCKIDTLKELKAELEK